MKILIIEPNKNPITQEIDDQLETMQSLVGGVIQAIYPFEEPIALICNDEGKLLGLPFNRALYDQETGTLYDIICGTMFLCGAPLEEECFCSLTEEQLARYTKMFYYPEVLVQTQNGFVALKMEV